MSRGGVPKRRVPEARITRLGLEGDAVKHTRIHGGPRRAVCLYSAERLEALRAEAHPVFPGALGENVTLAGLDWEKLAPGVRLQLGDSAVVELTSYTTPCKTIASSFRDGDFARVHQDRFPGWSRLYALVLVEGVVREGDMARRLD